MTKNKTLPPAAQAELAEHATEIRRLGKQTIENVIEIGRRLSACRAILKQDRKYRAWLESEFGSGESSARNFINAYELSKSEGANFAHLDLPLSSLYLLAQPSCPPEARDEMIKRARAGEKISVTATCETIKEHKSGKSTKKSDASSPNSEPKSGRKPTTLQELREPWFHAAIEIKRRFVNDHWSEIRALHENGVSNVTPLSDWRPAPNLVAANDDNDLDIPDYLQRQPKPVH